MTRRFISDLADGEPIDEVFLVRDKQVRSNRNGQIYLQFELDDRSGSVSARYWNASESDARGFEAGDFIRVKGKAQLFQGQIQVIATAFERADPDRINLAELVPTTAEDVEELLAELRRSLGRLKNPFLQAIAQAFLIDDAFLSSFTRAPAGIRHHHAYAGGLLEHVVTLLRVAERVGDVYGELDLDMLKMGCFLHDVGKIRELSYERGFSYADEGQLVGHLVIGVEMLNEKLSIAGELLGETIPDEVVFRLKHMIVSHHGTHEYGSPKTPMTPEAIALHHLDNLDAKVHNFTRTIRDDRSANHWTPYDNLLARRLYKGAPKPPGG